MFKTVASLAAVMLFAPSTGVEAGMQCFYKCQDDTSPAVTTFEESVEAYSQEPAVQDDTQLVAAFPKYTGNNRFVGVWSCMHAEIKGRDAKVTSIGTTDYEITKKGNTFFFPRFLGLPMTETGEYTLLMVTRGSIDHYYFQMEERDPNWMWIVRTYKGGQNNIFAYNCKRK